MAETKTWIKKHAVMVYFIITLLISWTGLLIILGPLGFIGKTEVSGTQIPLMFLAMYTGPVLAGLLMTVLTSGRPGLLRMLSGFIRWRVGPGWYLFAILAAPTLTLAAHVILSIFSPAFLPSPGYLAAATSQGMSLPLLVIALASGILTGFCEELGWTGFAAPMLRSRFGILRTGVIIGLVWGLWHLPLFTAKDPSGAVPLALLLLVRLFTHLPAFRVLMVWFLEWTRSPFMVMLMHASLTASALLIQPRSTTAIHAITVTLVLSAMMWLLAALVIGLEKHRRPLRVSVPAVQP